MKYNVYLLIDRAAYIARWPNRRVKESAEMNKLADFVIELFGGDFDRLMWVGRQAFNEWLSSVPAPQAADEYLSRM